jgi:tetratricopeptide (TPR) repeat protein
MARHHSHRVEYAAPMPVRTRLRALALFVCVAVTLPPTLGIAQETSAANVAAARKHFERARTYYGQGAYRDAVVELEAAHELDPNAKDLVFNLGVVHEKLSDIDEALKWFRLYTTMELLAQERERADAYVRRLEGAKREAEEKQAAQQRLGAEPIAPPSASPERANSPSSPGTGALASPGPLLSRGPAPGGGRVDGLTIGAASVATAGLALGAVLGVKALVDRPPANSTTSLENSYEQLTNRASQAHVEAIVADIGFSVALVAGVATAYLYFGRSRGPATSTGSAVSLAPLSGGGALMLKGRF